MAKNTKIITDQIFKAYLNCKHKSYLKLQNRIGQKSDYEKLQEQLDVKYQLEAQTKLVSNYAKNDVLHLSYPTLDKLSLGKGLILDMSISMNGLQASFDALKKCSENSKLGSFSYEPVSFCRHQKIKRIDKLFLIFECVVLNCLQGVMPQKGFLILKCARNNTTCTWIP